jgi:hypothetical protein
MCVVSAPLPNNNTQARRIAIPNSQFPPLAMSKFIKWIRKVSSSPHGPPPKTSTIIHVPRAEHEMEWNKHQPRKPIGSRATATSVLTDDVIFVVVKSAQGATEHRELKEVCCEYRIDTSVQGP